MVVVHEIPGLHPQVVRFADRIVAAGMTAYLPTVSTLYVLASFFSVMCVRREFSVWSTGRSSPIVDWLRALARHAHDECGGRGVGAIGMCLTGGFALAMMTESKVIAPVLAEPSLPLPITSAMRAGIDASAQEIACARQRLRDEDLSLLGLRFRRDPFVPDARFEGLGCTFEDRFEAIELDPADAEPTAPKPAHSVLTLHLRDDDADGPTWKAEARVVEFFCERLGLAQGTQF